MVFLFQSLLIQSISSTVLLWWSVLLKSDDDFSDDFSDHFIELRPNWTAEMVEAALGVPPRGAGGCRRSLPDFVFVSWGGSAGWGGPTAPRSSWPRSSSVRRAKHGVNGSWSMDSVGTSANCDSQLRGNFSRWRFSSATSSSSSSSSKALRGVVALEWDPFRPRLDEPSPAPTSAGLVFVSWAEIELTESFSSTWLDFFPAGLPLEFCWHNVSNSNSWPRKLKFGEMLGLFPFTKLQKNANGLIFQEDPSLLEKHGFYKSR